MKDSVNDLKIEIMSWNAIQLLSCPFIFDVEKGQLELADLQSDRGLEEKGSSVKCFDILFSWIVM
jgi:hypothetical protein